MPIYQVSYQIKKFGSIEVDRENKEDAIAAVKEKVESVSEFEKIEAIELGGIEKVG